MNFAISYSGGKDSALAIYRMIRQGHNPVVMITTVNATQERSWFHGIDKGLLRAISGSMRIPLLFCDSTPDNYEKAFEDTLKKARSMGAEACAFGDIDIEEHKVWNHKRCANAGLDCILPLWQEDREIAIAEMLSAGFKALIKVVDSSKLDKSFLGQTLTAQLIEKIKAAGADACGENGEYHTFVYDGPIFAFPIPFTRGQVIDLGSHQVLECSPRGRS